MCENDVRDSFFQKLSDLLVVADLTLFNRARLSAVWSLGFGHISISIKGCYLSECYSPVSVHRFPMQCAVQSSLKTGWMHEKTAANAAKSDSVFFFP